MDTTDFDIMKAIADLKVPYPKADKINSLVRLDPEELGARLGGLEMEGYVKTKIETDILSLRSSYAISKLEIAFAAGFLHRR